SSGSDIGSPQACVQKSVPSSWLAAKQVIGWPSRSVPHSGSRAAVSQVKTRAWNASSSTEQPSANAASASIGAREGDIKMAAALPRFARERLSLDHALDEGRVGGGGRQLEILLVVVVGLARPSGAHVALAQELVHLRRFRGELVRLLAARARVADLALREKFFRLAQDLAHAAHGRRWRGLGGGRRRRRRLRRRGRRGIDRQDRRGGCCRRTGQG